MARRVGLEEALSLYESMDLNMLSKLATDVREEINGKHVYYNRNFHLEPSNVCIHRCRFCSYRRESDQEAGSWSMDMEEIKKYCIEKYKNGETEVHIVGSVHPNRDFKYYLDIVDTVRGALPKSVTIKAYTAVEIDDMTKSSRLSPKEVLQQLKEKGVELLPGGGAEIFNPQIRDQICPDKTDGKRWLEIHKEAHKLGMRTNCTMLFGHIESRRDRIEHLFALRELQDETGGFDAFIPLLFKPANNPLSHLGEVNIIEVLKTFAIARIVLDNIPHIKSYWPMLGKEMCQLALLYGADDMDGTINDSTKIYSLAGSKEKNPQMTTGDLERLASEAGYVAVERDSFYNIITKKS
ncbi:MAG: aminofutalosine synthase MqnE [Bacteroidales bacterium]|jgi:aminodeoxyfutalosine synthase|nr:aminofutalosine synthase MqnE [Bacteroidales bacterium]